MKKLLTLLTVALAFAALSACVQEKEGQTVDPQMTISVTMPEEAFTKAAFSIPDSGPGLHLAWQSGDKIRVINAANPSQNAAYSIQAGFTDHYAQFSGAVVKGDYFNIVAPGTYTSVEEAEAGDASLTQNGNNSTAHLVFTAMLGNVSKNDLPVITFSDDWVAAHPGTTLNRGGIVKFDLTLPNAITKPVKVTMYGIGEDEVSVNLKNVNTSSNHQLIAYAQCGWTDIPIPAFTTVSVSVQDNNGSSYLASKTITTDDKVLKAGAVNIVTFSTASSFKEQPFAGGQGTEKSPWLIATAKQLENMHSVLAHQDKKYFRLIKDIDMKSQLASKAWVPLNMDSPYDCPVSLDGDGHTVSNFTINTTGEANKQTGFFGVLYGDIYNIKFTNATVTNTYGKPTGILCGYCGYEGKPAHVYNVHIQGSVTFSSGLGGSDGHGHVGGLAGRIHTCLIESCSADVNVSSTKNYAGGLFGIEWASGSTVRNCWTSGTVNGSQRIGGICGGLIKQYTHIVNCFSTATINASYAIGGIVGHANLDKGVNDPSSKDYYRNSKPGDVVSGCIAWNDAITSKASDSGNDHYSSGAIIGVTSTHNTLQNCLYKSDINFTDYVSTWIPYDQENANASTELVVADKGSTYHHHFPYHGKAFSGTLSAAAKQLGWNSKIWNLKGDVPVLTGVIDTPPVSGDSGVPAASDGGGPKRPSNGGNWDVHKLDGVDGITYYHYKNTSDPNYVNDGKNTYQEAYVVDVDLNSEDYEVKVIYTSPAMKCSDVFAGTNAYVAINGAYERGSIVLKANASYEVVEEESTLTDYPFGRGISMMPNDYITDNDGRQVPNWKSHGAFYCDGKNKLRIAFDAYDSSKNPPVMSVEDQRFLYTTSTAGEQGVISSSPVLIANYNKYGQQFHNKWYPSNTTGSSEDPHTHQRGLYPRTAVALTSDNHLLLFVCDGRYTNGAGGTGMSANWVTKFLADNFNPQYALNLDGGGSSTMCVRDYGSASTNVVNYPCDNMGSGTTHNHEGERARDSFIVVVPKGSFN